MLIERADFVDLHELYQHRRRLWCGQKDYVLASSPLHRRMWGHHAPPDDLAGLPDLPLISKDMLRESQRAVPPFGDYLAADPIQVTRVHRTSGTTGTAMNLVLSVKDAVETAVVGGRALSASGLGLGHRVVHCLNHRMWMGGTLLHGS